MAKLRKNKHKKHQYNIPVPGSSPGLVHIDEHSLKPKIKLHTYNSEGYGVTELADITNLKQLISNENQTHWVEIKGFDSVKMFETLNEEFGINKLVLEDITGTYQRPKYEEYGKYDFAVSRMLYLDEEGSLENEQLSFVLTKNTLFTFQDKYEDCLGAVRKRLEIGKGNIRAGGCSYLMYALMDMVVDEYFSVLGYFSSELDEVEDRLFDKPERSIMFDTQGIKRQLIALRRVVWPERDKMNDILRSDSPLISDQTKMFLKDAYDHCIQIIDMV
ncbi:MAG: magnesium and cobalt transport protein CorA, partial [Pedobacter sp.]